MPLQPVQLALRSNVARDAAVGPATLINCYADSVGPDAMSPNPIYACDGFASFATLTSGGVVRGMLNLDDSLLWVMSGGNLYSVTTGGTATNRASVATSGYAYFARNRATTPDIAMVTSDNLTRLISGTTVTTPSYAAGVGQSLFNSVCGIAGYFVFTKSNGEFYISGIDATTVDVTDFATAQNNADGLLRGVVRGRDLVLFGPRSCEFWQNTGAADFPFQPVHQASFGLYNGPGAVAMVAMTEGALTDTVIWPATGPDGGYVGVCQMAGYEARKVSTWEVDNAIKGATKANVRAYTYPSQGNTFYAITDGSSFTYEYNPRTSFWHRRKSSGLAFERISDAAVFNNLTIFGDYTAGALFQQSTAGVPAAASLASVRVSRDNGTTWSTARTKTIGASGARTTRTKFNRFGQSQEDGFQIELAITNALVENGTAIDMTIIPPTLHAFPRPIALHSLYVNAIPGASQTANAKGAIALMVDFETVGAS